MNARSQADLAAEASGRELLTIDAACARVHVSRRTIYNWMARGLLDTVRTAGGRIPDLRGHLTARESAAPLMQFIPVAGSLGARDGSDVWWTKQSPWLAWMAGQGFTPLDDADPFYWSTDLSRRAWVAGGLALGWYCRAKAAQRGGPLRIVSHSFGMNVVAYAAYYGLEIDTLIAVGPPFRATLQQQYDALRFRTRRWVTIHATEADRMVIGGGLGDGEWNPYPPTFNCDYRDTMPGISHSRILREPDAFPLWSQNGWLELLR